jgi:hypothetical protein
MGVGIATAVRVAEIWSRQHSQPPLRRWGEFRNGDGKTVCVSYKPHIEDPDSVYNVAVKRGPKGYDA